MTNNIIIGNTSAIAWAITLIVTVVSLLTIKAKENTQRGEIV